MHAEGVRERVREHVRGGGENVMGENSPSSAELQ